MHVKKTATFSRGFDHFTDDENEFMLRVVSLPLEKTEEVTEEEWAPAYEGPEPETSPKDAEPVSRTELLAVVESITELIRTMQGQPAPIVNVTPEITLKPHTETKIIHRDERGRMESVETKIT